jgi:hypothetical protein
LSRTRSSYLGAYRLPGRRYQAGVSLGHPGAWRVVVASALLAPLSALVGAAVGAIVRHSAAAVGAAIVILQAVPLVVSIAGEAVRRLGEPTCERTAAMNANYGYQLYQAERTQTRAEVLAGDARRGRWAEAARRGRRSTARKGRGRGIMVIIAGRTARAA